MRRQQTDVVVFTNVSSIFVRSEDIIRDVFSAASAADSRTVVVSKGEIVCDGSDILCQTEYDIVDAEWVNLKGGSLS